MLFDDNEKISCFDRIASHFYSRNFGQMSKSDIELMMFDIFMKKMIKDNRDTNGTIDYSKCSDYRISQELGITQQKVKNLKVKSQLVYPVDYDWKLALAKLIKNARFDKQTQKVTLNIPDPNLYLEIRNFIEEQGAYVEVQLNSKILQLRAEDFVDLALVLEPENNRQEIIKCFKKIFEEHHKSNAVFTDKKIGKFLIPEILNDPDTFSKIFSVITLSGSVLRELLQLIKTFIQ